MLRDAAAQSLPDERVARCGRAALLASVDVRCGECGASYGGLVTCGSVWTCAVCAAKIAEQRRREVERVVAAHLAEGGHVYIGALTVPHTRIQSAQELRRVVAGTFRKLQAGKRWQTAKAKVQLAGMVRACEVTHGDANGWHPHLHVLFFIPASVSKTAAHAFGQFVFERWATIIRKAGYGECNPALWQFERTTHTQRAGDYVVKWGCDRELTQAHMKRAKGGGRTPWQLLEDVANGDKRAAVLFAEFAAAFKGARQLTWSRGLRERYGLTEEISDEQAASTETVAPVLGTMTAAAYKRVVRAGLTNDVLNAAERHGLWRDVVDLLAAHKIDPADPGQLQPIPPEMAAAWAESRRAWNP